MFDMDGTTVRHMNPRLLNVLEGLDDLSYKIGGFIRKRIGLGTKRAPLEGTVNRGKKPRLLVHRAIHKIRRKEVDRIVEPCPGIIDLLGFFAAKNIPMGIASNGLGEGYGHDILKTFDLEKFFKASVFREDTHRAKPAPDILFTLLERMDIKPNKDDVIWYIGDRRKDLQAAKAADEILPCSVIPLGFGVKASLAAVEMGLPQRQVILNYFEFQEMLARDVFSQSASGS